MVEIIGFSNEGYWFLENNKLMLLDRVNKNIEIISDIVNEIKGLQTNGIITDLVIDGKLIGKNYPKIEYVEKNLAFKEDFEKLTNQSEILDFIETYKIKSNFLILNYDKQYVLISDNYLLDLEKMKFIKYEKYYNNFLINNKVYKCTNIVTNNYYNYIYNKINTDINLKFQTYDMPLNTVFGYPGLFFMKVNNKIVCCWGNYYICFDDIEYCLNINKTKRTFHIKTKDKIYYLDFLKQTIDEVELINVDTYKLDNDLRIIDVPLDVIRASYQKFDYCISKIGNSFYMYETNNSMIKKPTKIDIVNISSSLIPFNDKNKFLLIDNENNFLGTVYIDEKYHNSLYPF